MKIIYYINKVVLIITLILYLTLFLGMYSQILLGATQVISSFLLILYWNRINKKYKKRLYYYWIIVTIYGLFWLFDLSETNNAFIIVIGIIIVPMSIAIYFFTIVNKIKKQIVMNQSNIFMTGNWKDLIISTFEVDKTTLEPYLPNGTEIDLFNGKALIT